MNIHDNTSRKALLLILSILLLFIVSIAVADDYHKNWHGHQKGINLFSYDKGNEFTGEVAALIFMIANITVLFSLLSKGTVRFIPVGATLKEKIKSLNKFQKKYLMPIHYFLNPVGFIIAFVHFFLSKCITSFLPEFGFGLMAIIGVAGIFVKFKISPKSIRRVVYWLHTNPMPLGFVLTVLFAGHIIVD